MQIYLNSDLININGTYSLRLNLYVICPANANLTSLIRATYSKSLLAIESLAVLLLLMLLV